MADITEPQPPYLVRRAVTRNQTALSKTMAEIEGNPDAERPPLIDAQILTMTMDDNIRTRNRFNDAQREVMMKLDLYDKELAEQKAKQALRVPGELRPGKDGGDDGAAAASPGHPHPTAAAGVLPEASSGQEAVGFGHATQQPANVGDGDGVPANQQQPNVVDLSAVHPQQPQKHQPSAFYPMHDYVGPVPPQNACVAATMNFQGHQQVGVADGSGGAMMAMMGQQQQQQTHSVNVATMLPGAGGVQRTPQAMDGAAMVMYGAQQQNQGVVVANDAGGAAVFAQQQAQQGNNNNNNVAVAENGEHETWYAWMTRLLKQELF